MKKIKTSPYLPESFEVEQVSEREAKITAFPFESGFAVSLAHPLRRFLLSSSTGFAPVGVKVEGASHEFDSIRGMLEDISEFIINLKAIRFKMKSDEEFVEVSYTFTGPMEIKGSDLNSEEVEILTEDVTLATLNSDATLNFSLLVYRGIGYVPSEDIREELPEGYIALDAHFTPVQKAVYTIDKVLVEDNPDFEKIIMTIVTDGQISPVEAFNDALGVMHAQMKVFNQNFEAASVTVVESSASANDSEDVTKLLQKIDSLGLSARSFNCLDRAGIKYVGEIAVMNESELKNVKNLGKKSLDEIKDLMNEIGLPVEQEIEASLKSAFLNKIS